MGFKHIEELAQVGTSRTSMRDFFLKELLSSRASVGLLLFSCYFGAQNHEFINRVEDYVLHHNISVEQNYFRDPRGLEIDLYTNEHGEREVYLLHTESGKRLAIMEDMAPSTDAMLESLEARMDTMSYSERGKLQERLYSLGD
ncbi:MAG: hypothetical protein ACQESG_05565 [Nanobdellota archaeon]